MIYQIRAILYLKNEGAARGLFNHIQGLFPQAVTLNPDSPHAEISYNELIENHHDTDPASSCLLLLVSQTKAE